MRSCLAAVRRGPADGTPAGMGPATLPYSDWEGAAPAVRVRAT